MAYQKNINKQGCMNKIQSSGVMRCCIETVAKNNGTCLYCGRTFVLSDNVWIPTPATLLGAKE